MTHEQQVEEARKAFELLKYAAGQLNIAMERCANANADVYIELSVATEVKTFWLCKTSRIVLKEARFISRTDL